MARHGQIQPPQSPLGGNIAPQQPSGVVPATPEERRAELERGFEDVQGMNRSLNSRRIINENKLRETKTGLIQNLFRMMQDLGVDPTNLESINAFLQELEARDPDLRELFEVSFNYLINDSDVNPQASPREENGEAGLFGRPDERARSVLQPRE